MLQLLKYELKGRKNMLLGGSIAIILLNIIIVLDHIISGKIWNDPVFGEKGIPAELLIAAILIIWVIIMVLIIVDSVNILKKDLYENTGYLLFTIPRSSYSILLSKMLTTVIEFFIFGLLFFILAMSIALLEGADVESTKMLFKVLSENMSVILQVVFATLTGAMLLLATIYFSLVLTKSLLKDKKYSGAISFGIFILINIAIFKLNDWIFGLLPVGMKMVTIVGADSAMIELSLSKVEGVGMILFNMCLFVILFFSTGYLLENRADI